MVEFRKQSQHSCLQNAVCNLRTDQHHDSDEQDTMQKTRSAAVQQCKVKRPCPDPQWSPNPPHLEREGAALQHAMQLHHATVVVLLPEDAHHCCRSRAQQLFQHLCWPTAGMTAQTSLVWRSVHRSCASQCLSCMSWAPSCPIPWQPSAPHQEGAPPASETSLLSWVVRASMSVSMPSVAVAAVALFAVAKAAGAWRPPHAAASADWPMQTRPLQATTSSSGTG